VTLRNSIVANNNEPTTSNKRGYLYSRATSSPKLEWADHASDRLTADPLLVPLADNGARRAPTRSCRSRPSTRATRPVVRYRPTRRTRRSGSCDIGAFESQVFNLTYSSGGAKHLARYCLCQPVSADRHSTRVNRHGGQIVSPGQPAALL
jgi:hypothetical protein